MIDIRLPNITATDPAAQMSEVRSYLYQMVEQLNWALNTLDTGSVAQNGDTVVVSNGSAGAGSGAMSSDVLENFGSLKSLIIKTAKAANSEIGRLDDAIANLKLSNKAIDSVSESYYKSTSPTELKDGSWVDKYPGWEQGTYIWTRSTITYSDGSTPTVTEPICVTGSTGNTGSAGYTPIKGVDYFDGTDGKDGADGAAGKDGVDGKNGIDGKDGAPGKDGAAGKDGAPGKDGVDGKDGISIEWKGSLSEAPANPQKNWAYYNTVYKASYIFNGEAWYQMSIDGVDGANGKDGKDGEDGKNGISIVWKGELSSSPASPQENWVYKDTDDGKVYIYHGGGWELMVADGSDGTDGAQGATGPQGPAGSDGKDGAPGKDGVDGKDGTDGKDGENGLSVFITYNDSSTVPEKPTGDGTSGGWHTDATSAAIWISQKVAATATSGEWGEPIKIKGDKGDKGETGETGETGNGIAEVDVEYRLSDSDTELTGDYEWQTSIDTIPEECSLWTRNKITYTNGDVAYTAECCISRYNIDTVIKTIRDAVTEGTQGVYAYMESQQAEYEGLYYAKSDFGEFLVKYEQVLSIDPTKVEQVYNDTQILRTETESIREAIISTNANIKTGILYYDDDSVPIYGVEVGQTTEVNGEEMFNKFARFTSSRLSFYDANGGEVAYISDYKLYITNAQILGNLYLGSYILDTTNGLAFIWNG